MAKVIKVGIQPVTVYDPSEAYNGYTLYGSMGAGFIWLIDMQGRIVQEWQVKHVLGTQGKLLPDGNLLVGNRVPGGPLSDFPGAGGEIMKLDWDNNEVWKYKDPYMNSHDWCPMENGNVMMIQWIPVPKDIAAKVKGGIPGSEREGVMWGDRFMEITPEGKVVWEWLAHEHVDFKNDVLCSLCPRDLMTYVNSVVVLPDGNILTHFRLTNTIAIIDKKTGEYKWRWGSAELGHAHNPTLLDNGNILIFDNGFHRLIKGVGVPYSRALEINPKTNEIEWEYKDPNIMSFYSSICGSAQRLPNGNTLMCESTKGRLREVNAKGETVWEFVNPFYVDYRTYGVVNMVFRALRYGPDYKGLKGRTLDPDRFEWRIWDKSKGGGFREIPEEKVVSRRLAGLGY